MKKGLIIAGLVIIIAGSAYLFFKKSKSSSDDVIDSSSDSTNNNTNNVSNGGSGNTSSGGVGFKKGQKLKPKQPLIKAKAYDRKTGKFLAYFTSATFEAKSTSKDWIFATVNVPGSGFSPSVPTSVQLKTNDWI
jgi:hypothetical protein